MLFNTRSSCLVVALPIPTRSHKRSKPKTPEEFQNKLANTCIPTLYTTQKKRKIFEYVSKCGTVELLFYFSYIHKFPHPNLNQCSKFSPSKQSQRFCFQFLFCLLWWLLLFTLRYHSFGWLLGWWRIYQPLLLLRKIYMNVNIFLCFYICGTDLRETRNTNINIIIEYFGRKWKWWVEIKLYVIAGCLTCCKCSWKKHYPIRSRSVGWGNVTNRGVVVWEQLKLKQ